MRTHLPRSLLCLLFAVPVPPVMAQSVSILSGGSDAHACSVSARLSSTLSPNVSELAACDRAIDDLHISNRDRAGTFVNRGILLTALGSWQEALNDYNRALELMPALTQAFNGKGNIYFIAERYDDAIAAYQQALALDLQEKHVAYYNLGLTHDQLHDAPAAEQHYRLALDAAPDWVLPQQKLAARAAAAPSQKQ